MGWQPARSSPSLAPLRPHDQRAPMKPIREGLTFDDVLLAPRFSAVHQGHRRADALRARRGSQHPLVSAAMDTVTVRPMAIAMAREPAWESSTSSPSRSKPGRSTV